MFDSIKEYLAFFYDAKNLSFALRKGDSPKVGFTKDCSGYFFIAIFGSIAFIFVTIILSLILESLGALSLIFVLPIFLSISLYFFAAFQAYFYYLNDKNTSFKILLLFNLTYIFKLLHIPFPKSWQQHIPYVPSVNKDLQTSKPQMGLKNSFLLLLGKSTGLMSKLWHSASLAPDQNVFLALDDSTKNILVLGGIGSGKTSALMQPLLLQLLSQGCGGLIFDIKGDVKNATLAFAKETNRKISIIGASHSRINLIAGLTPEIASSFLKSSLLLANQGHLDLFWIDTASELSRNVLGLLSFLPEHYTLSALYGYIFDDDARKSLESKLDSVKKNLSPSQIRLFNVYHQYKSVIFDSFDEKVKSGVKATLAQAISPFNHPVLTDAFCSNAPLEIEEILESAVFLVDMPLSVWGLGAKVAYTFIKLRFFNLMQKHNDASNRELPVFFMCDEFQEIVSCNKDGLSDLNFWDKSRSSKTIGIISAQSISSFFAATPSRDYAYALLQNFRNKLCLATEDPITIEYISQLTGKANVLKKSKSLGHNSSGETISEVRDSVLEAQVFRSLSPASAVALLNIGNKSSDDAISLFPLFIKNTN